MGRLLRIFFQVVLKWKVGFVEHLQDTSIIYESECWAAYVQYIHKVCVTKM